MFINEDIPASKRKHGFYEVRGNRYSNKFLALRNCPDDEYPKWNFNDQEFAKHDFSVEPKQTLAELYKARALQIRKDFDNVIISFSGGIDSICVLHSFIDNNIPIDGVLVTGTYSLDSKLDTENFNTLEQRRVALPYLKHLEKTRNIKFNIRLLDTTPMHLKYEDEQYVYALGGNLIGPRVYAFNFIWQDPWLQDFLMKGKTATVRGIDKPRLFVENGKWYFAFLDSLINDGTPSGVLPFKQDWDIQEYFFWTPDLPQIVIKQAHVIAKYLEKNCSKEKLKTIATKNSTFDRKEFCKYADPLCYSNYLTQRPGQARNYFHLPKPFTPGIIQKDYWFHQLSKTEMSRQFEIWLAGVNHLQEKINSKFFNSGQDEFKTKTDNEFHNTMSKYTREFNLEKMKKPQNQKDRHIIFGAMGCWSPWYYIKDYEGSI